MNSQAPGFNLVCMIPPANFCPFQRTLLCMKIDLLFPIFFVGLIEFYIILKGAIFMSDKVETKVIEDMIAYQDGAVVSKTIIEKETGNITLFAFDKGEYLSEHTAPFDAMVQVLDGELEVAISDNSYTITQDEMIIMPAKKPHSLEAVDKSKMLLTMIKD